MPGKIMVSVVVPCYNHAQFLPETIESVLRSDYSHFEIVIVNDGSVDNSGEIALALSQKHDNIRYVSQQNSGPAAARNHGIRIASGEYILPLDADDLISPRYIGEAVKILTNETIRLVYCEARFFGDRNGVWKLPPFSRRLLARENMIFSSALYRRSDWEECGGYDERMTWGWEDWEFWISLLKSGGDVYKIPETGFYYRVRKNSRRKSTDKEAKRKTVDLINSKHREFVHEQLAGPLRYQRTHSRLINQIKNLFTPRV